MGWIITLIVIAAIGGVGAGVYFKVKRSVEGFSRTAFGTSNILEGYKSQQIKLSQTPRSIKAMTSIYLPLIERDFPDFNYNQFKQMSETLLMDYLTAIMDKAPIKDTNITDNIESQVDSIVGNLQANDYTAFFINIKIHRTEITRYEKSAARCSIILETALEYVFYTKDSMGKIVDGTQDMKTQTLYQTELSYVQDLEKASAENTSGTAVGVNCPNCGAPIANLGHKHCEFCGTAVKEININSWNFNSIKEVATVRK